MVRSVYPDSGTAQTPLGGLATRSLIDLYAGNIARAQVAADAGRALVDSRSPTQRHRNLAGLLELGWAESFLERYADAERHLNTGITAARHVGREDLLPRLLVALAHVAGWTGRLPAALWLARRARRHADADVRCAAAAMEATAGLWIGGHGSQARSLELTRAAVGAAGLDGWWGRMALASLGHARLFGNDAAGCVRLVLDAGKDAELSGLPAALRPMWFGVLCAATLRIGELTEADIWAGRAEAMGRQVGLGGQQAFAAMARGQVLVGHGDQARAAEHLRAAAAGFGASGMALQRALALVLGARATAADGHPKRAADMLQRAHRAAALCGSRKVVELAARGLLDGALANRFRPGPPPAVRATVSSVARAAAAPAPAAAAPAPATAAPAPATAAPAVAPAPAAGPWLTTGAPADERLTQLTDREWQIARLAATGTKTRTIARQLGVSPRTVDVHLSRIYRKLAVPGRTGLVTVIARLA
jgi:DNA-binding CsgD family transcriptional regulator